MPQPFKMAPGFQAADVRLGRVPRFDRRSRNYPIRALMDSDAKPRSYTWRLNIGLDQGQTSACTGFATAHEIAARPVPAHADAVLAMRLYQVAQKNDQWPGENYAGSSVLGAMKAAADLGYYHEYRWAFGLNDALLALGYHGPVVLGVNWYDTMFEADLEGTIHVGGAVAGGHAILANRIDVRHSRVWLSNSWGPGWGLNGGAWLAFADLYRLLHEDGECAVPVSRARPTTA